MIGGEMMFDENQLVEVKWSGSNRKWYESKGYKYTKLYDILKVKAKDLPDSSKVYVKVVCDLCGEEIDCMMINYNNRVDKSIYVCKKCSMTKVSMDSKQQRAKKKFDEIRKICEENDYELLSDESEYVNVNTVIKFICKKHGMQSVKIQNFLNNRKCAKCSMEEMGIKKMHTQEYIKSVIESFNGNIWLNPNEYMGTTVKNLRIQCGLCGQVFVTSFNSYSTEKTAQRKCFSCSCRESKGEVLIRKFLEENNIIFEREKSFSDCKDILPLPFDFYLPEYNLLIEFDGQHHYENRGFGNLEKTQMHDKIKNKYCEDNNINLLRIPYWEGSKINEILTKQLNL